LPLPHAFPFVHGLAGAGPHVPGLSDPRRDRDPRLHRYRARRRGPLTRRRERETDTQATMPIKSAPTTLRDRYADEIQDILSRYPVKRSASMPLLWLAQRDNGHITTGHLEEIGELIGMSRAELQSVV